MKYSIIIRLIFSILIIFSGNAQAFNCDKAATKTEKIICRSDTLILRDENYNKIYQQIIANISQEKAKIFKNQIKELLKARDNCVDLDNKSISKSKKIAEFSINDDSKPAKFHKLRRDNFVQGCIATWYDSIASIIKLNALYTEFFNIPTYEQYFAEFNNLKNSPYIFNDQKPRNQELQEVSYKLFFPNKEKNFIQIINNNYNYAGGAHGFEANSIRFLIDNKLTSDIGKISYQCSVPLTDPVVINGKIFIPEKISFTKFFDKMLGEYNEEQPYVGSGSYEPDCLLKLQSLNKKDDYIIFKSGNFINEIFFDSNKAAPKEIRQCAMEIIKSNQEKIDNKKIKIAQLEVFEKDFPTQNNEFFIIKEAKSALILDLIKSQCLGKK